MSRTLGFPGNRLRAGEESRTPGRTGRDGEPMGRWPDGGVQRRRVRDRGHAAGARPARARVGDERPVARHRAPVAELPGLRDQLHHDRRHLAGPPRHLPASQVREHPGDAAEPAAADDGLVPALSDRAGGPGGARRERRARGGDLLRRVAAARLGGAGSAVAHGRARPQAAAAGGHGAGDPRDHEPRHAQHRPLRGRHRACDLRPQRRGRLLPGDRAGHRGAGARRYAGARSRRPAGPPEPDRQQNSSSLSPGRRVRVPPSSSS